MRKTPLTGYNVLEKFARASLAIALTGAMAPMRSWALPSRDAGTEGYSGISGSTPEAEAMQKESSGHDVGDAPAFSSAGGVGLASTANASGTTVTMRATLWDGSVKTNTASWAPESARGASVYGGIIRSVSVSVNTNGLTGGITGVVLENPNDAGGYRTRFKMSLYGQAAQAYYLTYWVHGLDQPGAGGPKVTDGKWASHNGAAVDGIGWYVSPRSYAHTVSARFQQPDGSWSSYIQQRSGSYAYLSQVPLWTRPADETYQAASMSAYTAGFTSKANNVDVYRRAYTAAFDAQGGTDCSAANRELLCGASLGELPAPSRSGYRFEGWYDSPIGGTRVSAETTMPTSDTVYYAHWSYGVSYEANGGEGFMAGERVMTQSGEACQVSDSSFTRPGYQFANWNTKPDGSGTTYEPYSAFAELETPGQDSSEEVEDQPTDGEAGEGGADSMMLYAQWKPLCIQFSVPSDIECTLDAAGAIHGPSTQLLSIDNESDIGLTVGGIKATGAGSCRLDAQPHDTGEFDLSITPGQGDPLSLGAFAQDDFTPPADEDDWRIPAQGKLALNDIEGQAAGIDSASADGVKVGSITWLLKPTVVTILYKRDDGSDELPAQKANASLAFLLPELPDNGSGKSFAGWSSGPHATGVLFAPGEHAAFSSSTTLYPIWN